MRSSVFVSRLWLGREQIARGRLKRLKFPLETGIPKSFRDLPLTLQHQIADLAESQFEGEPRHRHK